MDDSKGESVDCFICRKHRREVSVIGGAIYGDDLIYAGHVKIREGESTAYLGYLMVETKRHIPSLAELTETEAQAMGLIVAYLSRALKTSEKAEHVYDFVLGNHVPHLHIHVIPRYVGTPREYWGTKIGEWPRAPKGGPKEIEATCIRIRTYLKDFIKNRDRLTRRV